MAYGVWCTVLYRLCVTPAAYTSKIVLVSIVYGVWCMVYSTVPVRDTRSVHVEYDGQENVVVVPLKNDGSREYSMRTVKTVGVEYSMSTAGVKSIWVHAQLH
jgi:hypothetical protein